ncbi:MAG TPA: EF-P lysine aminoacylase GenX [Bdellovibrionales bacterium]|nr:EF-P lysine aminoacylase GenX [Bdellovibrionales bacterium]
MNRDEFLSQIWQAYPTLPQEAGWVFGRWSQWSTSASQFAPNLHFGALSCAFDQVSKILNFQDAVALKKNAEGLFQEVLLLSPASDLQKDLRTEMYPKFCLFLKEVRSFFEGQDFLEMPTPTLVSCPGMEAHLEAFAVETDGGTKHLPTSPEISLKKRLCEGNDRIFEIKTCFRKDPKSPLHRQEFFMLEWYRAFEPLESLKKDLQNLLAHLHSKGLWMPALNWTHESFQSLFKKHLNFDFRPETGTAELKSLCQSQGIYFHEEDEFEDLIHRIFMERFEPQLKDLVFLEDFPPQMAVLSRLGSSGFAQRFELYWNQWELANAFFEVNDPELQEQRWDQDLAERKRLGKILLSKDMELVEAMKTKAMPPSSGIALGLDRLFMAGLGLQDISEIGF